MSEKERGFFPFLTITEIIDYSKEIYNNVMTGCKYNIDYKTIFRQITYEQVVANRAGSGNSSREKE